MENPRRILTIHRQCVVDTEVMKKCIRPKLGIEVGTDEEGTNMVTNDMMSALNWTILMRRIGSSKMDLIVMICKHVKNIGITIKLTTLVHKYILVLQERAMDLQPFK